MQYNYDKGNDVLVEVQFEKNSNTSDLSAFSSYQIVTTAPDGTEIRTYKTSNSEADGKLYEDTANNLIYCFIETRDSDTYSRIDARVKAAKSNSELKDDTWDYNKEIGTFVFR
jgi:hypothetical protein